jgi:hypothetical protein
MPRTTRKAPPSYSKVSATLEEGVLNEIRERTPNVSGFLNEAAKAKLYFDRLKALDEDLAQQGIEIDERFYENLKKATAAWRKHQAARVRRAT